MQTHGLSPTTLLTMHSVKKELARLQRNKERRHAREKQKNPNAQNRQSTNEPEIKGEPSETPQPIIEKPTGTARKCANCGQVGHIKTNKKYGPNCEYLRVVSALFSSSFSR